jgi:hypothetical protein
VRRDDLTLGRGGPREEGASPFAVIDLGTSSLQAHMPTRRTSGPAPARLILLLAAAALPLACGEDAGPEVSSIDICGRLVEVLRLQASYLEPEPCGQVTPEEVFATARTMCEENLDETACSDADLEALRRALDDWSRCLMSAGACTPANALQTQAAYESCLRAYQAAVLPVEDRCELPMGG